MLTVKFQYVKNKGPCGSLKLSKRQILKESLACLKILCGFSVSPYPRFVLFDFPKLYENWLHQQIGLKSCHFFCSSKIKTPFLLVCHSPIRVEPILACKISKLYKPIPYDFKPTILEDQALLTILIDLTEPYK